MRRVKNGTTIQDVRTVFEADLLKTLEGPTSGRLFVDQGDDIHNAFMWQLDFFNPNPSVKRSTSSIGVMTVVPLNLPADIRYKPEYVYAVVIPGPVTPKLDSINHSMCPIMDHFVNGWYQGFQLPRTGSHNEGRKVIIAVPVSANDLPAALAWSTSPLHH